MCKPICNRILSAILAAATVVTLLPMVSMSAPKALESELPDQSQTTVAPSNDLPWDHDTLYITLDGEDIESLPLYSHEKVEIEASGLVENAAYQWQVEHPEKDDVWVNVYDGTEKTIRVTQALVENVLRADGTARLRCRAYTDSYAYLSNTVTVTVLAEENAAAHTTYAMNREGDVAVMAENSSEFVTAEIHYVKYEYVRHVDDKGIETYVLEEKGEAYGAYVATIRNGSDLSVEVPNPSIVGYEANLVPQAGAEQSDGVVSINLANITTDVSFRVEYRPAEVPYSVHYYFQNIYDDQYVEDNTLAPAVTLFGYTGMHPDVTYTQATFTGFTSLFYEPDIIAGDGSTVFNVYYERNYYLMEFDCNGGYGTDTIYVRYGTYVAVADPVRAGYVFGNDGDRNGWDLVSTDDAANTETLSDGQGNVLPQTMPAYNSAYKAIWDTTQTTYTVVYWRENADDNGYSYWGSKQIDARSNDHVSATNHTTATGLEETAYFTYNANKTLTEENKRTDLASDGKIIVEGDGSTVVNVYYSRNVYTLQFNIGNNTFVIPGGGHVHGDGNCLCNYSHVHGPECEATLTCAIPAHTAHTADCIICGKPEHTHGTSCSICNQEGHTHTNVCCKLTEHIHDITCYGPNSGYQEGLSSESNTTNNAIAAITNPQEGYIYRYCRAAWNSTTYYNFFYTSSGWYYLGTGNQYRGLLHGTISNPGPETYSISNSSAQVKCENVIHSHGDKNCDYSDCSLHVHTASCYKCGQLEHKHNEDCCTIAVHTTHTTACYTGVDSQENAGSYAPDNPAEGQVYLREYYSRKYIYIQGEWYRYTGSTTNGNIAPTTCHTHGDGKCIYCSNDEHSHSDACMDCGLTEHTHENSCYRDIIHTHIDDCYEWSCGESTHVHSEVCCTRPISYTEGTGNNQKYYIKAKYNQTIGDIWPTSTYFTSRNFEYWSIDGISNNATSKRVNMTSDLCNNANNGNKTKEADPSFTSSSTTQTLFYMFESYDQNSPANGDNRKELNSVFYDSDPLYEQVVYSNSTNWNQKQITGMTAVSNGVKYESNNKKVFFYYSRSRTVLEFHNVNTVVQSVSNLMYDYPLKNVTVKGNAASTFVPTYPSVYEPGAYEFKGWYTTPECFDGTEVKWDTMTMPDGFLTLYAKWIPVKRNVYFHLTYEDIATNTYWDTKDQYGNPVSYPIVVEHGAVLGTTYHYMPERNEDHDGDGVNDYIFVGWFYMDEDNKKRFAPDTMEIKRDLHLFAEWQSLIDTQYKVEYVLKDAETINGVAYTAGTTLAVITEGHSTAGRTKTFTAKAGDQLLDAFKDAPVFPMTNTHSILMDADPTGNTYRFEYVLDPEVYYKVRYVDKVTGEVLGETGNLKTNNSIVTEKFKYFEGYVPEQFYIRKVLASDGEATTAIPENVITFYYLPNTEENQEALYNVEYYKKNPITGKYEQVQNEPGRGEIDKCVSVPIPKDKFTGYVYTKGEVLVYKENGSSTTTESSEETLVATLSRYGLVFKVYYDPIQYPYLIKFVEYGNPTHILGYGQIGDQNVYKLDDVDEIKADYDKKLAYTAPNSITDINGKKYNFIDNSERTQTLTIRIDDLNEAKVNILTFYYEMEVIPIEYHAVCTVPGIVGGNVSQSSEPKPQNPQGCEAMVLPGFVFEGWFYDDACTQPVTNQAWISGTKITPTVDGIVKGEDGKEHFYALFKPIVTELTIEKTVNIGEDRDDSFLFHVQGVAGTITGGVDLIVAITGNGEVVIKELYCGEYTVTELTGWSWEYDISGTASKSITLVENATNNKVSFSNTYANPDWLGDECCKDNNFK